MDELLVILLEQMFSPYGTAPYLSMGELLLVNLREETFTSVTFTETLGSVPMDAYVG
jgi:hypothetical protein